MIDAFCQLNWLVENWKKLISTIRHWRGIFRFLFVNPWWIFHNAKTMQSQFEKIEIKYVFANLIIRVCNLCKCIFQSVVKILQYPRAKHDQPIETQIGSCLIWIRVRMFRDWRYPWALREDFLFTQAVWCLLFAHHAGTQ